MDELQKLELLSGASQREAGEDGCRLSGAVSKKGIVLTQARLPNGKSTTLLKSLLSTYCENDCLYCCFRRGRDIRRASYQPEEFARVVLNLTNAGLIQGVFLSSGVFGGGVLTQDRLIATAEVLRNKFEYRGYLHLKIMPGAEYDQVLASMRLADRVSVNLEAPNARRLPDLAPSKRFLPQLLTPLRWINQIRRALPAAGGWKNRWPSSCTQFVVGGAGESDLELLETSQTLHRAYGLWRVYYSALKPELDTPLQHHDPIPLRRELRLYQADFLLRDYGFSRQELILDPAGNLPLESDPKQRWAQAHLAPQPLELNRASREELLRVPGIGLKSAEAILKARRWHTLRDLGSLEKLGIRSQRAAAFVLLDGRRPPTQPSLFALE